MDRSVPSAQRSTAAHRVDAVYGDWIGHRVKRDREHIGGALRAHGQQSRNVVPVGVAPRQRSIHEVSAADATRGSGQEGQQGSKGAHQHSTARQQWHRWWGARLFCAGFAQEEAGRAARQTGGRLAGRLCAVNWRAEVASLLPTQNKGEGKESKERAGGSKQGQQGGSTTGQQGQGRKCSKGATARA